jgi:hypothetical protein
MRSERGSTRQTSSGSPFPSRSASETAAPTAEIQPAMFRSCGSTVRIQCVGRAATVSGRDSNANREAIRSCSAEL